MDRAQFLRNLRSSKVPVTATRIDGWDGPIYLRAQTVGEVRESLLRHEDEESLDPRERIAKDPYFIARGIARLVRDESGALLFDPDDDGQMLELMTALADTAPAVSKRIHDAYNALNEPTTAEVTTQGN